MRNRYIQLKKKKEKIKSSMKKLFTIIFCLSFFICNGQSLGKERVDKLNKTVVKIKLEHPNFPDSIITNGTGFVISKNGLIATNFHVIEPILVWADSSKNRKTLLSRIFAEFVDGKVIELSMSYKVMSISENLESAIFNDFLLLLPTEKHTNMEYLKLGNWSDLNDGDEIYSSGYPLGIDRNLITKGIVSSKFIEKKINILSKKTESRDASYLDLTMNKGNSGGPIIKLTDSIKTDVVVGIATFVKSPYNDKIQEINKKSNDIIASGSSFSFSNGKSNISTIETYKDLSAAFQYISVGISGCVSIEYLKEILTK
jgi:serine protease Do